MREGIMEGVARANADAGIEAIVLLGEGKNFISGADIRRFGSARPVSTRTSAAAIEASEKPVVAAMHGYALGGDSSMRLRATIALQVRTRESACRRSTSASSLRAVARSG
ncbi:enoyl-CoA hydratase-related protein [Cupriavidus basilensis]